VNRHRIIPLDAADAWSAALEGIPHAIAHTHAYARAMQRSSGFETFLYCFDDGTTRIVTPLAERPFGELVDVVTPYGFSGFVGSGEHARFPELWREFARSRRYVCGYIGLHPLLTRASYVCPSDVVEHHQVYVLDLTLSIEQLFRRLSELRRRGLKAWRASESTYSLDRERLAAFFVEQYTDFMRARGARDVYLVSKETLIALCEAPTMLLVGGCAAGRLEAVALFGYTPYVGDYLFSVSVEGGQRHTTALIWYAVQYLQALGVPLLNLGGGIRPNDGVAQYKERFGAARVPLRALQHVYRAREYAALCRRVGADPRDRGGYFPAYRARGARPERAEEGAPTG